MGELYLIGWTSGHRTWRLEYRFRGKDRRLLLGAYPGQIARWKPVHAAGVMASMETNVFGEVGGFPVDQIAEDLLLTALRKVEGRGAIETAHRLRQRAERVFRFAAGAGGANANLAFNVPGIEPLTTGR